MIIMEVPDFNLKTKNPNSNIIPDAQWWLWERCFELEPEQSELSGFYADKPGFHNTGNANEKKWPSNYSIRDATNRRGPWWRTKCSAFDWTFKDAKIGDYKTIDKYTSRLMASARDRNDPRLDLVLFEFYGQDDNDKAVEGWNEFRDEFVTSDSSHLWHIHFSFLRSKCGDFWAFWALYTVLIGWTVAQWRASLQAPPVLEPRPPLIKKVHDMKLVQLDGDNRVYESEYGYYKHIDEDTFNAYRLAGYTLIVAPNQRVFNTIAGRPESERPNPDTTSIINGIKELVQTANIKIAIEDK